MKTKTALLKLMVFLPLTLLFANCGGSSGSGSSSVSGYYIMNNACYISGGTTPTATTNCQTGTYYIYENNGTCVNTAGTNVGIQYCTNNATTNGLNGLNSGLGTSTLGGIGTIGGGLGSTLGSSGSYVCNGVFLIPTYGGYAQIGCNAYDYYCSGQVVYTSTGQGIRCQ